MFDSITITALTSGLNGLAERQRAIASNVANINTPGYHARTVDFESALSRSVAAGDGHADATEALSTDPTRLDGNNVNLDTETLDNVQTVLRYQLASQSISSQFSNIRAAIGSGA